MNKFILLIVLCVCTSFISYSQEFTVGVKGGVNYSYIGDVLSFGGSYQQGAPNITYTPDNEIGTQFGGFINVEFGKFFIRPELLFTKFKNSYDFPFNRSYWNSKRIDIPIMFGYEVFKPISIYAGPIINSTSDMTIDGVQQPITFDKRDINIGAGILVDFGRFGFDVRYEISTTEEPRQRTDFNYNSAGSPGYGVNVADMMPYKLGVISISAHINIFSTDKDRIGSFFGGLFRGDKCYCPYD
ncbi:porin family protein [Aegicerativicinus sediminis]|uniref:outer membrane beta-barrel protein n=1 Tax=Aegicerativicinus sediminis TaxID=2893202 RepID=UPI001E4B3F4B|nr:outer membrane beta-barrel protein [Aegicerativicinus sediminis]